MTTPAEDPVLVVSHEASRTGAVIQLLSVLEQWKAAGHPFDIIVRRRGPLLAQFRELGTTTCLTAPWTEPVRRPFDRLRRAGAFDAASMALRRRREQVGRRPTAMLLNTATNGDIVDHLPRVPTVTWVHEQRRLLEQLSRPAAIRRLAADGRHLAAVSESVRDDLAVTCDLDPGAIEVIYPAPRPRGTCDRDDARRALCRELGLPAQVTIVGACGALSWEKSPESLLAIATLIAQPPADGRPIAFVWLGEGRSPDERIDLSQRAAARGLANVHFLGAREDPLPFFAALDLFVVLSITDSFPVAALEAARESVPVLCFGDAGGISEFVRSDAGVVIPTRDLARMAQEIERLSQDAPERARLAAVAAERVSELHRPEVTAARLWRAVDTARGQPSVS